MIESIARKLPVTFCHFSDVIVPGSYLFVRVLLYGYRTVPQAFNQLPKDSVASRKAHTQYK
jgi:hypothetical protein